MANPKRKYWRNCVSWPREEVGFLFTIVDNSFPIAESTFRKNVCWEDYLELQQDWGYDTGYERGGLRIKDDWAVVFYRSIVNGEWFYYIQHSSIEYIFKETNDG